MARRNQNSIIWWII